MLIKSQDKNCLIKFNQSIFMVTIADDYHYIEVDNIYVAKYKTRTRALEILKEIEQIIIDESYNLYPIIYQMPEEMEEN